MFITSESFEDLKYSKFGFLELYTLNLPDHAISPNMGIVYVSAFHSHVFHFFFSTQGMQFTLYGLTVAACCNMVIKYSTIRFASAP